MYKRFSPFPGGGDSVALGDTRSKPAGRLRYPPHCKDEDGLERRIVELNYRKWEREHFAPTTRKEEEP